MPRLSINCCRRELAPSRPGCSCRHADRGNVFTWKLSFSRPHHLHVGKQSVAGGLLSRGGAGRGLGEHYCTPTTQLSPAANHFRVAKAHQVTGILFSFSFCFVLLGKGAKDAHCTWTGSRDRYSVRRPAESLLGATTIDNSSS